MYSLNDRIKNGISRVILFQEEYVDGILKLVFNYKSSAACETSNRISIYNSDREDAF